jgi:uncharacterized protein (DUF427 family)
MHPKRLPLKPGQESVWDYPRPPRVEATSARVVIRRDGRVIADTTDAVRVLETSHPPVYYLPRSAFEPGTLESAPGTSFCEFKGEAHYVDVAGAARAGWFYPSPSRGFESLVDRVAVYPSAMNECSVDGEIVQPQEGDFYGGWITAAIVGPFKGAAGTWGW